MADSEEKREPLKTQLRLGAAVGFVRELAEFPNRSTLQKIHSIALQEFLERGFRGASLREIVKKAGVTTGAFYGYYKSKEELFDALVKPHADHLRGIFDRTMEEFRAVPKSEWARVMSDFSARGMNEMFDYASDYRDAFRLILCSSEGTKFENYIHEITEAEIDMTHKFYETISAQGFRPRSLNPTLEHMLISGMFSAFFELLIHDIPKDEGKKCVKELYDFYQSGWRGILGV